MEGYAHWYPEEATFRPKTLASSRPGSAKGSAAGALSSGGGDGERGLARMERLYHSYEKVGLGRGWGCSRAAGAPATRQPTRRPSWVGRLCVLPAEQS